MSEQSSASSPNISSRLGPPRPVLERVYVTSDALQEITRRHLSSPETGVAIRDFLIHKIYGADNKREELGRARQWPLRVEQSDVLPEWAAVMGSAEDHERVIQAESLRWTGALIINPNLEHPDLGRPINMWLGRDMMIGFGHITQELASKQKAFLQIYPSDYSTVIG